MEGGNYYYTVNTWGYRYCLKDLLVKETWGLDSIDKNHLQRGSDAQVGEFQDCSGIPLRVQTASIIGTWGFREGHAQNKKKKKTRHYW